MDLNGDTGWQHTVHWASTQCTESAFAMEDVQEEALTRMQQQLEGNGFRDLCIDFILLVRFAWSIAFYKRVWSYLSACGEWSHQWIAGWGVTVKGGSHDCPLSLISSKGVGDGGGNSHHSGSLSYRSRPSSVANIGSAADLTHPLSPRGDSLFHWQFRVWVRQASNTTHCNDVG